MTTQDMTRGAQGWRIAGWSAAAGLLLLPAAAMQVTQEVRWTAADFVFAGIMLGGVGLLAELAVRASGRGSYRAAAASAIATGFVSVWIDLAVGIIGGEHDATTGLFAIPPAVALAGAVVARGRAAGMARAMAVAAGTGLLLTVPAWQGGARAVVPTLIFAAGWLASAALFRRAAR
jgi:hypothetical protein